MKAGYDYHVKALNESFYRGLEFWLDKDLPWLVGEIKRGNWATVLQITMLGLISTVTMRTTPYYETVASKAANVMGWWFPFSWPVVAFAITTQSLRTLYPPIYYYYLGDKIKIDATLRSKLQTWPDIRQFMQQYSQQLGIDSLDETALEANKEKIVDGIVEIQKKLIQEKMNFNLETFFKAEPAVILPIGFRAAIGAFVGTYVVTPCINYLIEESLATTAAGAVIGAATFGGIILAAEYERVKNKLMLQEVCPSEPPKNYENSWRTTFTKFTGRLFNVGNGISQAVSMMGLQTRKLESKGVTGNTERLLTLGAASVAADGAVGNILFYGPMVQSSMLSIFARPEVKAEEVPNTPAPSSPKM